MALEDYALCSLRQVKLLIELPGEEDTDINSTLELIINGISRTMINYCNLDNLKKTSYTEYSNGNGTNLIFTRNIPITQITSLHDSVSWDYDTNSLINSSNYRIVNQIYIMLKNTIAVEGFGNIQNVYTAGLDPVPDNIVQDCAQESLRAYQNRKDLGVLTITRNDGSVTYMERGLMKQTKEDLNPYRRLHV